MYMEEDVLHTGWCMGSLDAALTTGCTSARCMGSLNAALTTGCTSARWLGAPCS